MKKFLLVWGILLLIFTFSCASDPKIKTWTMTPAEIDLSSHKKNIAITSTQSAAYSFNTGAIRFSGDGYFSVYPYQYGQIGGSLTQYFNNMLISKVSSANYFNKITTPPDSDLLADPSGGSILGINREELIRKNDIGIILKTSIPDIKVDEYISSSPYYSYRTVHEYDGSTRRVRYIDHYDYTLYQTAHVTVRLDIIDAKTNRLIHTRNFTESTSKTHSINYGLYNSYSLEDSFKKLLEKISNKIVTLIMPSNTYTYHTAMKNEPKLEAVSSAYKMLEEGNYEPAFHLFYSGWMNHKHVPSGYNAALLLQGQRRLDEAIVLMEEVYKYSMNNKVFEMLAIMKAGKSTTERAIKQL